MAKNDEQKAPVVKKVKKVAGGHHGGAWKVAYADFTTAMMAFFMLLWLLNVSDKETLEGLADYFSPTSASVSGPSGAGKPFAGTAMDSAGTMGAGATMVKIQGPPPTAKANESTLGHASEDKSSETAEQFEAKTPGEADRALAALADQLRQAIQNAPKLARFKDQVLIEETPDGVRIQITDKDRRPLFRKGTAEFYPYAEELLADIGAIISSLPNRIAIVGHTDAGGFGGADGYSNWELSADRANAARRVLARSGVTRDRFAEVTGKADTEPLYPTAPLRPENRRIAITVLREAPVVAPGAGRRRH